MTIQKSCLTIFLFMLLSTLSVTVYAHHDGANPDADGDGHPHLFHGGDDCDDGDAAVYPGAVEVCDTRDRDEDCDASTIGLVDPDGDGFNSDQCANYYPDGRENRGLDCDDTRADVSPMAPDFCDGRDNNCNGVVDDYGRTIQFADLDLDGYGDPSQPSGIFGICPGTVGWAPVDGDCDDSNPAIQAGDMKCDTSGSFDNAVLVCTGSGSWQVASCGAGSVCQAQANGTGVCVPEDSKVKKNK